MNANDLAVGTLDRLFERTSDKILAHIDDTTLNGVINGLHSPYTADEKEAISAALRAATTQDEVNRAIAKHAFWYALNHWWTWLIDHWSEVEAKVEDERRKIDRVKLSEGQTLTEKHFAYPLAWKALQSQQTVDAWEALTSLRAATDAGDESAASTALHRFFDAAHRYPDAHGTYVSHWYKHVLDYWRVDRDTDHLFWMTGRWIDERAGTIERANR